MNCEIIQKDLQAYLDHEVNEETTQSIRAHLTDCASCRGRVEFLEATKSALGWLSPQPFPWRAQAQLLRRVAAASGPSSSSHAGLAVWPWMAKPFTWMAGAWTRTTFPHRAWGVAIAFGLIALVSQEYFNINSSYSDRAMNHFYGKSITTSAGYLSQNASQDSRAITESLYENKPGDVATGLLSKELPKTPAGSVHFYATPDTNGAPVSQKIIKTGYLNLEVAQFTEAVKRVEAVAARYRGYLVNTTSEVSGNQRRTGSVVLRVPSTTFDRAVADLEGVGKVLQRTVQGQDVSEEYVDVEGRLKNAERVEARIQSFLAKAQNAKDAAAILHELDQVGERVEQLKGRKRFLETSVAQSAITVALAEPASLSVSPEPNGLFAYFKQVAQDIVQSSVRTFTGVVKGFFAIVSFLLPIAGIGALAAWGYLKIARRITPSR